MKAHDIRTRDLHFAAYLKANGAEFVGYAERVFQLRADQPIEALRVAHANSCCRRVDLELIELRKFLRG